MHISSHVLSTTRIPMVSVEHHGAQVDFVIRSFDRKRFDDTIKDFSVFDPINQYFEYLGEPTTSAIFDVYKAIHLDFDIILQEAQLTLQLEERVAQLFALLDIDKASYWLRTFSGAVIPASVPRQFVASLDQNITREKTYIATDYQDLLLVSFLLRAMIPIWGHYISSIRASIGNHHKEFYAFQLLKASGFLNHPGIMRLLEYINHNKGDTREDWASLFNGVSSEDMSPYLLAMVCVRKLCTGDIRGFNDSEHLVTLVYRYIFQKIRSPDSKGNAVTVRKDPRDTANPESNTSMAERYRVKASSTLGQIGEVQCSIGDPHKALEKITLDYDERQFQRALQTTRVLMQFPLVEPQCSIVAWVLSPAIMARASRFLSAEQMANMAAVAQTVLWSWGYTYMAVLVSSHYVVSDHEMIVTPVDSKKRIVEDVEKELLEIFPVTRQTASRRQDVASRTHLITETVSKVAEAFTKNAWRATADDELLQQATGSLSRRIVIRPDIKTEIARLMIKIGRQ